jgi:hypothetical protein
MCIPFAQACAEAQAPPMTPPKKRRPVQSHLYTTITRSSITGIAFA